MTAADVVHSTGTIALVVASLMIAGAGTATRADALLRRRRRRMMDTVRVRVLTLLDDQAAHPYIGVTGEEGRAIVRVVLALVPDLRSSDRERFTTVLVKKGVLRRADRQLRKPSTRRRVAALRLIGVTGHAESISFIMELLSDRKGSVRAAAATALGRIGRPDSIPALIAAFDSKTISERVFSIALFRIGRSGTGAMLAGLPDRTAETRAVLIELLGTMGEVTARKAVLEGLGDVERSVRLASVRALGRLGLPNTSAEILGILAESKRNEANPNTIELQVACIEALGLIGETAAAASLDSFRNYPQRRSFAAWDALDRLHPQPRQAAARQRPVGHGS